MDQTMIIILVIVVCVCLSSSIGGGIGVYFATQPTPTTTTKKPKTTTTPAGTTGAAGTTTPAGTTGAAGTTTPAGTTGATTPVPYNYWQCYLNSNNTRRDGFADDGYGIRRDNSVSQADISSFCNQNVSDCGNLGGCTAYKYIPAEEPVNSWNCYLNNDRTRRVDNFNDGGKAGIVRSKDISQAEISTFCNNNVSDCGNLGGCTAYKRRP